MAGEFGVSLCVPYACVTFLPRGGLQMFGYDLIGGRPELFASFPGLSLNSLPMFRASHQSASQPYQAGEPADGYVYVRSGGAWETSTTNLVVTSSPRAEPIRRL